MIKNKIDYKLINIALIVAIIYLLSKTSNVLFGNFSKIWDISLPFLIAFVIAYALYPLVKFLTDKHIPKIIAIIIVLCIVIGFLTIFGVIVVPLLFNQLGSLFNGIISFVNEMSTNYDLDFGSLQNTLTNSFDSIIFSKTIITSIQITLSH